MVNSALTFFAYSRCDSCSCLARNSLTAKVVPSDARFINLTLPPAPAPSTLPNLPYLSVNPSPAWSSPNGIVEGAIGFFSEDFLFTAAGGVEGRRFADDIGVICGVEGDKGVLGREPVVDLFWLAPGRKNLRRLT